MEWDTCSAVDGSWSKSEPTCKKVGNHRLECIHELKSILKNYYLLKQGVWFSVKTLQPIKCFISVSSVFVITSQSQSG